MKSLLKKLKAQKKTLGGAIVVIIALAVAFFFLADDAARKAAEIFNEQVAKQKVLKGTITAGSLSADLKGRVVFTDLVWNDEEGNTIASIPRGSMRLRLWDAVMRNFKTTTIQELTLEDAKFSVRFTDDMKLDFVAGPKDKAEAKKSLEKLQKQGFDPEEGEKKRKAFAQKVANFDLEDKKLKLNLILKNCEMEAFHKKRVYILTKVNSDIRVDTSDRLDINFNTGPVDGTFTGDGLGISGTVDFKKDDPELNVRVSLYDVDTALLGFGENVKGRATLVVMGKGPVTQAKGSGTIHMKYLEIPALRFEKVAGDVTYEDGRLEFLNVEARVFYGDLEAYGDYDIDTRAYNIVGRAKGLDSRLALNDNRFKCEVDLDFVFQSKGTAKETIAYGTFTSGKGHYSLFPFTKLSGRFTNRFRDLEFADVLIESSLGLISTDELRILSGKLHLGDVYIRDRHTGKLVTVIKGRNATKAKDNTDSNEEKSAEDKKEAAQG